MTPPTRGRAPVELPCPAAGCGLKVTQPGRAERTEPHQVRVSAADVGKVLTCPCHRHAMLRVTRRRTGLALSALEFSGDARVEHNLIAHALTTGQGYVERGPRLRLNRAPDPDSGEHELAVWEERRLHRAVINHLHESRLQAAIELVPQAVAAEDRVDAMARRLDRRRHAAEREQPWHGMTRFWIRIPVPVRTPEGERPEPDLTPQFTFTFEARMNPDTQELEVVNGEEIEAASGVNVGADGWRALIRLLTRFEAPPGRRADPHELVWRDDRGTLTRRDHVRRYYPRAVLALDALRHTLKPDQRQPRPADSATHPDWPGDRSPWADDPGAWVEDAPIADAPGADRVLRDLDAHIAERVRAHKRDLYGVLEPRD